MTTPAQVTEEHIYTTAKVGKAYVAGEDAQAAQLIADSEAKAVVEIAMVAAASADRNVSLRLERDQLRAEVERLREWQAGVIANERLHHAERKQAIARAERAEAELHALRLICGTTDADKFSTWVDRANAKSEKAESELAGIRALADRRNKRDHAADTTHQLVAALDQALDIAQAELAEQKWIKESAVKRAKELTQELAAANAKLLRNESDGYLCELERTRTELAAERAKVRTLRAACESICEEWGRNHDANPIGAGQKMETLASKALEKLEDAT